MIKIILLISIILISGCSSSLNDSNTIKLEEQTLESNAINYNRIFLNENNTYTALDFVLYSDLELDESVLEVLVEGKLIYDFSLEKVQTKLMEYYVYATLKGVNWSEAQDLYSIGTVEMISKSNDLVNQFLKEYNKKEIYLDNLHLYYISINVETIINSGVDNINEIVFKYNGIEAVSKNISIEILNESNSSSSLQWITCCQVGKEVYPNNLKELIISQEFTVNEDVEVNKIDIVDETRKLQYIDILVERDGKLIPMFLYSGDELSIELKKGDKVNIMISSYSEKSDDLIYTIDGMIRYSYSNNSGEFIYIIDSGVTSTRFDPYEDYFTKVNGLDFHSFYDFLNSTN